MNKVLEFVQRHIDFGFQNVTWVGIIIAISIIPAIIFLPEYCGFENGIIENIQLIVLFFGIFLALRSKCDKKFFYFIAMVIGILLIREVNCGRTIFFAIPGEENTFYSWSEIKYGWLAHVLYGIYISYVGFYFLVNKLIFTLWQKLYNVKFPIWNFLLLLIAMIAAIYAEDAHLMIFEESAELLFYVVLISFIYLYSQHQNFISKDIF